MSHLLLGKRFHKKSCQKGPKILTLDVCIKGKNNKRGKRLRMMRLEELMGSLKTFDIELSEESKEWKKLVGAKG